MSRVTITLLLFLACLGTSIQAQEPYWEQTNGPGGQIDKLVFDSSENMYAVGDRVWRSTDEGNSWKEITPTLTPPLNYSNSENYRIAVSPEGILYLGEGIDVGNYSNRVGFFLFRSEDKGETWKIIKDYHVSVDICALSGGRVFLSGWGEGNRSVNCLLISSDNGNHWSQPSGIAALP